MPMKTAGVRVLSKAFTTVSAVEQLQIDADTLFLKQVDDNAVTAVLEEGRRGDDINVAVSHAAAQTLN